MTLLDHALKLSQIGFRVFPLIPNSKKPAVDDFTEKATTDEAQIKRWWNQRPYNIGISTTRSGNGTHLVVVDIDFKPPKKDGHAEVLKLELEGKILPPTLSQRTPTGGEHLFYRAEFGVKQGADVLAPGVDIRGQGGYVVGSGSILKGQTYTMDYEKAAQIEKAPQWVIDACGKPSQKSEVDVDVSDIDPKLAEERALFYLENEAPIAVQGNSGDQTTYRVAARVKDFGVVKEVCLDLLLSYWNERCSPPWNEDELAEKVEHAYRYGNEPPGIAAPETQFEPVKESKNLHPFERLNGEFAFVTAGGGHHILWESADVDGNFHLEHLTETAFHKKFASYTMMIDDKPKPVTQLWMKAKNRRSYDGVCFRPGKQTPEKWYNLWRGFAVDPIKEGHVPSTKMKKAVDLFLEHALKNVCNGDRDLFNWLIGYFAHIIQKPWEKPLTALVFRGSKGVGKNALIKTIGSLLGSHYFLTPSERYLIGNFNSHFERLLLFVLDEATWAGNKQAEGTIKDLITGDKHRIEHKGKEPYTVDNVLRVVFIGNEDWLVPASEDERRFAVFDVGEGRKQDRAFFKEMRELMESGGNRYLLRYLLDFDISKIDVNEAPMTAALLDQKLASLDMIHQWWLSCLQEERIVGADFGESLPKEASPQDFMNAFQRYAKDRNARYRFPDIREFGKKIKSCAPSIQKRRKRDGAHLCWIYQIPPVGDLQSDWERFIGHKIDWGKE